MLKLSSFKIIYPIVILVLTALLVRTSTQTRLSKTTQLLHLQRVLGKLTNFKAALQEPGPQDRKTGTRDIKYPGIDQNVTWPSPKSMRLGTLLLPQEALVSHMEMDGVG